MDNLVVQTDKQTNKQTNKRTQLNNSNESRSHDFVQTLSVSNSSGNGVGRCASCSRVTGVARTMISRAL